MESHTNGETHTNVAHCSRFVVYLAMQLQALTARENSNSNSGNNNNGQGKNYPHRS